MFRKFLMTTTALVMGSAVAFAAHERGVPSPRIHPRYVPGHVSATLLIGKAANRGAVHNNTSHWIPGAIFNNFSKDKNAEFVSWYGLAAAISTYSHYQSSQSWSKVSEWQWNATPFTGTGKAPKKMSFAGIGFASSYKFKGVILSATASGLPGNVVASTSSTTFSHTQLCCTAARTVKFHGAPVLTSGKKYFAAVECANAPCVGFWNVEDTDFSGAAADYERYGVRETYNFGTGTRTFSYSASTGSPFTAGNGALIIK
jgi:hypothetical protein